jgi:hypothetical protein
MDTVGAALIGAGVGSTTSIAAQFIAHGLGARRDRRNHYRAELHAVIVEVALALYEPSKPPPERTTESPMPEPLRFVDDPSRRVFVAAWSRGLTLLHVHFGHGHPIIADYMEAYYVIVEAMKVMTDHAEDDESLKQLPVKLRAAQVARDVWMTKARAHVDRDVAKL